MGRTACGYIYIGAFPPPPMGEACCKLDQGDGCLVGAGRGVDGVLGEMGGPPGRGRCCYRNGRVAFSGVVDGCWAWAGLVGGGVGE